MPANPAPTPCPSAPGVIQGRHALVIAAVAVASADYLVASQPAVDTQMLAWLLVLA
jgi:hypothetical protein